MFKKEQIILTTSVEGSIKERCLSLLDKIVTKLPILKIAFFSLPANNDEYMREYSTLRATVAEYYGSGAPLVSYIAQEPFGSTLNAEVTLLADTADIYRRDNSIILEHNNKKELITGGIIADNIGLSTFRQAANIFVKISDILKETGLEPSDIYRQWNYIADITTESYGSQNYQEFNDARSTFYNPADWSNGYPAATGIGQSRGGVMIELYAAKGDTLNRPIDNPMQVSAHSYSQKVLAGDEEHKTTPKFERARIMGNTIYISGTAAIKGENSLPDTATTTQAAATMQIMDCLVSPANIPAKCSDTSYSLLRIYVKHKSDIPAVKKFMEQHYPEPQKHYLVSDICRPELLIEIEGVAQSI